MKVQIRSNNYPYYEEKEMSRKEILDLRREIRRDILSWFKWEDYPAEARHLIIFAELLGEGYIYRQGLLMDEDDFEHKVQQRVTFADVIHKKDLPPSFR